jgi:hypothetical protein
MLIQAQIYLKMGGKGAAVMKTPLRLEAEWG